MAKPTIKPKKKGRPKIILDWDEFKKLCEIQCTLEEIAAWFACSPDTIELRCKEEKGMLFTDYFKKHATGGKMSLRRAQFKAAVGGNSTMLIWMGKQFLEQKDRTDHGIVDPEGALDSLLKSIRQPDGLPNQTQEKLG